MLGFDAVRPNVPAAPDGAWRDGSDQLLWEAKSEQLAGGSISAKLVRQANSHPTWVQHELDWDADARATTFLVSPRTKVDEEAVAVAFDHVFLCNPAAVESLATESANLWAELAPRVRPLMPAEAARLIEAELTLRHLTTTELAHRLEAVLISEVNTA